jgi:hypothetical protein
MKLQMAFRTYKARYAMLPQDAYRLARHALMHHLTLHDAWMRWDRGEVRR